MTMTIESIITIFSSFWWPFLRILGVFSASPLFGDKAFSWRARILLSASLALICAPLVHTSINVLEMNSSLIFTTFQQLFWGVMFGTILHMMIGVLSNVGQIISMQMGLAMAVMNDPSNGISIPILGRLFMIFALLLFLALDGHLVMITIIVESFRAWPVGTNIPDSALALVVNLLSWMMAASLALALPAVGAMLLSNFAFGIMNRVAPSFNIFALGFPMTMILGLLAILMATKNIPHHYYEHIAETMAFLRSFIHGERL